MEFRRSNNDGDTSADQKIPNVSRSFACFPVSLSWHFQITVANYHPDAVKQRWMKGWSVRVDGLLMVAFAYHYDTV